MFYSVREKSLFAGKNLLIIGGGDSAIDWALNLQDTAGAITLIHRRNQFRAHEDSVRKLQASRTQILTFFELEGLVAADGALTGAVMQNNQTKETRTLRGGCGAGADRVQFVAGADQELAVED